jgi:hypothetical protein
MSIEFLDLNLRNPGLIPLASKLCTKVSLSDGYAEGMETVLSNILEKQGTAWKILEPRDDDRPGRYQTLSRPYVVIPHRRLALAGYGIRKRGLPGRLGTFTPLPHLEAMVKCGTTTSVFKEVIELRSEKVFDWGRHTRTANTLEYADDEETMSMRNDLEGYNELMATHVLLQEDGTRHSTRLVRIFNNRSFRYGGRFYRASYQGLDGHERRALLLNGKRMVELDFAGMHPAMLFLQEGLVVPDDPYRISGTERELVKRAFNVALNASSRSTAINALVRDTDCTSTEIRSLLHQLDAHFKPLAKYFYTGIGLELQRQDSDIAALVMNEFVRLRKPILAVHDSFLVLPEDEALLKRSMVSSFQAVTNSEHTPRIKRVAGSAPAIARNDHVMVGATLQPTPKMRGSEPDSGRK